MVAHAGVILADDRDDVLDEVRSLLDPGFRVLRAVYDGAELVAAARQLRPDVVVSDIRMPRLDGIQASRQIIANGWCRSIVLLTMCNEPHLLREALDAGVRGYVLKVDAAEELVPAMEAAMAGNCYASRGIKLPPPPR